MSTEVTAMDELARASSLAYEKEQQDRKRKRDVETISSSESSGDGGADEERRSLEILIAKCGSTKQRMEKLKKFLEEEQLRDALNAAHLAQIAARLSDVVAVATKQLFQNDDDTTMTEPTMLSSPLLSVRTNSTTAAEPPSSPPAMPAIRVQKRAASKMRRAPASILFGGKSSVAHSSDDSNDNNSTVVTTTPSFVVPNSNDFVRQTSLRDDVVVLTRVNEPAANDENQFPFQNIDLFGDGRRFTGKLIAFHRGRGSDAYRHLVRCRLSNEQWLELARTGCATTASKEILTLIERSHIRFAFWCQEGPIIAFRNAWKYIQGTIHDRSFKAVYKTTTQFAPAEWYDRVFASLTAWATHEFWEARFCDAVRIKGRTAADIASTYAPVQLSRPDSDETSDSSDDSSSSSDNNRATPPSSSSTTVTTKRMPEKTQITGIPFTLEIIPQDGGVAVPAENCLKWQVRRVTSLSRSRRDKTVLPVRRKPSLTPPRVKKEKTAAAASSQ